MAEHYLHVIGPRVACARQSARERPQAAMREDERLIDDSDRGEGVVLVVETLLGTAVALLLLGVVLPTGRRRMCALALIEVALLVWTTVGLRRVARQISARSPDTAVLLFSLRMPAALAVASAAGSALHGTLYSRCDVRFFFRMMLAAAGLFALDTAVVHRLQGAFRRRAQKKRLAAVHTAQRTIDALLGHADMPPLQTASAADARVLDLLCVDVALPWFMRLPEVVLGGVLALFRAPLPQPPPAVERTTNAHAAADAIFGALRPRGDVLRAADVSAVLGPAGPAGFRALVSLDDDCADVPPLVDVRCVDAADASIERRDSPVNPLIGAAEKADPTLARVDATPSDTIGQQTVKGSVDAHPNAEGRDATRSDAIGQRTLGRDGLAAVVAYVLGEHALVEQSARHTSGVFAVLHVAAHVAAAVVLCSAAAPVLSDAVSASAVLAAAVPVLLAAHAMLGDAIQKMVRALLFVLLVHPFDVGDHVVLGPDVRGASDEEVLRVRSIGLARTVFVRWNGLEVIVPNAVLGDARAGITNVSRARTQWERVEFDVSLPGSAQGADLDGALGSVRHAAECFLRSHPRDYCTDAPGDWDLRAAIAADNGRADAISAAGGADGGVRLRAVLRVRCHWTRSAHRRWVRHARLLAFVSQRLVSVSPHCAS